MVDPKNPKVNLARTTLVDSGWSLPPSSAPPPAPEPAQRAQDTELDALLSDASPLEPPSGPPRPLPPYERRQAHESMTEVNERPALLEQERLRGQQGSVEDLTDFAEAVPEETVRAQSPLEQFEEEASKIRQAETGQPVGEPPATGVPPSREPTVQVPRSFLDAAREKSRERFEHAKFPDVRTQVVNEPEDALTVHQPKVQPARVVAALDRAVEELVPEASSGEPGVVQSTAEAREDTGGGARGLPDVGEPPLPRFGSSPFGAASAPSSPTASDPLPRFDAVDLAPPLPRFGSDPEASPQPGDRPPVSASPAPVAGNVPALGGLEPSALVSPVHGGAFAAMRSQSALSFGEWFRQRVRMAGGVVPGSALAIAMALALSLLTALVTAVVVGNVRGEPASSEVTEAKSERTPSSGEDDDPETAPTSPVRKAASGDGAALEALKARPADGLSPKEILALSRGEALAKRRKLSELAKRLEADPKVLEQNAVQKQLMESAADDATMLETLELLVELPGPIGPDLLYEVWTGTAARTESTRLAETLVNSPGVRAKASPGLVVALDLRAVGEDCAVAAAIVPKAHAGGDRRSLHLLGRLLRRYGCGPQKREDCFPCLRQNEAVAEAIAAVRARPAPRY